MSHKIIDAFTFRDELDMLEYRLHLLYDYVDSFVICESRHTHTGKEKPLYLKENINRFKRYRGKMIVLECDLSTPDRNLPIPVHCTDKNNQSVIDRWLRENMQRDFLGKGVRMRDSELCDDDYVILSDCDELVDPKLIQKLINHPKTLPWGIIQQRLFYYDFTCEVVDSWNGCMLIPYGLFKKHRAQYFRDAFGSPNLPRLKNGGWHLAYFFPDAQQIAYKLGANADHRYDKDVYKKLDYIKSKKEQKLDLFSRGNIKTKVNNIATDTNLPPDWEDFIPYAKGD